MAMTKQTTPTVGRAIKRATSLFSMVMVELAYEDHGNEI
jgi:hypothetical protein